MVQMLVGGKAAHTFAIFSLVALALLLNGCEQQGYSVLAFTGTVIGVEVSQNPATQTPQAKLGYNRGEFAFVPTNRNAGPDAGSNRNGARDSADVLMEIRYGGIFDWSSNSGIYQRLAVGKTAVQQPGASVMFAKDPAGKVDPSAKDALTAALSSQQLQQAETNAGAYIKDHHAKIEFILGKVAPNGNLSASALAAAVDKAATIAPGITPGISRRLKNYKTASDLKEGLQVGDESAVDPLFNALQ